MSKEISGIEKLKKLNKKEVSAQTHISIRSLDNIIDKNFEELHITKTLGFIRILEKNYELDLSEWLDEFKEYKEQNPPKEAEALNAIEEKNSKMPIIIAFIIALFVIGYFVFPMFTKNKEEAQVSNQIISEIKDNIEDAKKIEAEPKVEAKELAPKEEIVEDTNSTKEEVIVVEEKKDNKVVEIKVDNIQEEIELYSNKLIFKPRGKVWIGVVNINDWSKKQLTINKEGSLDIEDGIIFMTGHSYFTIVNEGVSFEFRDMSPAYFYVKDKILNKISKADFKKLNKDSLW
jgi:F0F1-type ATP synthase membrane subunit b/b'